MIHPASLTPYICSTLVMQDSNLEQQRHLHVEVISNTLTLQQTNLNI